VAEKRVGGGGVKSSHSFVSFASLFLLFFLFSLEAEVLEIFALPREPPTNGKLECHKTIPLFS